MALHGHLIHQGVYIQAKIAASIQKFSFKSFIKESMAGVFFSIIVLRSFSCGMFEIIGYTLLKNSSFKVKYAC